MVSQKCTWLLETIAGKQKNHPRSRARLMAIPKTMDDPLAAMERE
jgi:hypothetical protein